MSLKRSLSDSECEDIFSDTKDSCMTPPGSDHTNSNCGGGHSNRKKRRGIIEKRRRDRINNSLTELRRLVPTAFEKQGSAKLEKAEILQMTVDHLKMLHAKGLDALSYDPHKFALDYHSIGFRECAAEVARFLVTSEGMDIQDPLRLRLMSHLQCFASQRELANKQASASSWGLNSLTNHSTTTPYTSLPTHHFNSTTGSTHLIEATSPSQPHLHQHAQQQQLQHGNNYNTSSHLVHTSPSMPNESLLNNSQHHHHVLPLHQQQQQQQQQNMYNSSSSLSQTTPTSTPSIGGGGYASSSVLVTNPMVMSHYHHHHHQGMLAGNNNNNAYIPNGKPPHRPWGAELAY